MRAPTGSGTIRRPSHHSTPAPSDCGEHLDGEHGARRGHQRAGEQRVGTDRHEQQRVDLRPHHRPPGGERIGGRAGRRREHDPVAAPPRQRPVVDLDDDLEHALPAGLLDRGLVQRPAATGHGAVHHDRHVDGHPLLDVVVARDHPVDGRRKVVRLGLREEADVAEVDPEQRRPARSGELGGSQQGAVTAEHDDQLAPLGSRGLGGDRRRPGQRQLVGLVGQHEHRDPGVARTAGRRRAPRAAPPAGRCGRRTARGVASVVTMVPPRQRVVPLPGRRVARRAGATGSTRRCPSDPATGWPSPPTTPKPWSAYAASATSPTAAARRSGSRTTPPAPSRSRPTSNCGLTISTRSASGVDERSSAGSTMRSEMKDRSATTSSAGGSSGCVLEVADVGAVPHLDPVVGLQRPGELAVADVDADDLPRRRGAAVRR